MSALVREPESATAEPPRRQRIGTLIGFYCLAHRDPSTERSPITIHLNTWAFCVGGCVPGHRWLPIRPVSIEELHILGPRFSRSPEE